MASRPRSADRYLPGRLGPDWRGTVRWSCLTGTAQVACCWFLLAQQTSHSDYRDAACAANRYVRRTIKLGGPPETRAAGKGSFPEHGGYCKYRCPNWARKFVIDGNFLEPKVVGR
jgi:hypothetical protein